MSHPGFKSKLAGLQPSDSSSRSSSKKSSSKKLSAAAALQQVREGNLDLESPDSILGQVNLRLLLNKSTFLKLPPLYQFKLCQLLPQVDNVVNTKKNVLRYVRHVSKKPNLGLNKPFLNQRNLDGLNGQACLQKVQRLINLKLPVLVRSLKSSNVELS